MSAPEMRWSAAWAGLRANHEWQAAAAPRLVMNARRFMRPHDQVRQAQLSTLRRNVANGLDADCSMSALGHSHHKLLETLPFGEPYRIRGVQSSGDKWDVWRRMSVPADLEYGAQIRNRRQYWPICQHPGAENSRPRRSWRRERNWNRTFSA